VQTLAAALRTEHAADLSTGEKPPRWDDTSIEARIDSMAAYCEWLMDRDRKSTPLKELQGRIWAEGYAGGEIVGVVFDDVPHAFARWRSAGIRIANFSSGSIQAQQLVFKHSSAGDLAGYIDAYFDTTTGAKRDAASYERIAEMLGSMPAEVLFISDAVAELDAARDAGMQTRFAIRPGNPATAGTHAHRAIDTFAGV
jgi:enolase-phosphatase E1